MGGCYLSRVEGPASWIFLYFVARFGVGSWVLSSAPGAASGILAYTHGGGMIPFKSLIDRLNSTLFRRSLGRVP